MTVLQKILCSFFLSALLCAGITILAYNGIINNYRDIIGKSAEILLFVTIFLILFIIILFFFIFRHISAGREDKKTLEVSPSDSQKIETPECPISAADFTSAEAVQVESVTALGGSFFMFRQPFAFTPGNPELLHEAENDVVYEEDGIHYINSNVFADDEGRDEFDSNFAKLVESVVNKIDA